MLHLYASPKVRRCGPRSWCCALPDPAVLTTRMHMHASPARAPQETVSELVVPLVVRLHALCGMAPGMRDVFARRHAG